LAWKDPVTGEISRGYREDGYFPEAFVNMLALLGWNPGSDQELFSMEELIKQFSLERVIISGAKFSAEKTKWFNQQYLRMKTGEELAQLYQPELQARGITADDDYVVQICNLVKDRATFMKDFWELSSWFFVAPVSYEEKAMQKYWNPDTLNILKQLADILETVEPFTAENLSHLVHEWGAENKFNMNTIMNILRVCVVGASKGPGIFDILALLRKKEVLRRIQRFVLI
jgi:glutamyl-tRNA synthetase